MRARLAAMTLAALSVLLLPHLSPMPFGDLSHRTHRNGDPIMFLQLFRDSAKSMVRAEVGHRPLQRERATPGTHLRRPQKRAHL